MIKNRRKINWFMKILQYHSITLIMLMLVLIRKIQSPRIFLGKLIKMRLIKDRMVIRMIRQRRMNNLLWIIKIRIQIKILKKIQIRIRRWIWIQRSMRSKKKLKEISQTKFTPFLTIMKTSQRKIQHCTNYWRKWKKSKGIM